MDSPTRAAAHAAAHKAISRIAFSQVPATAEEVRVHSEELRLTVVVTVIPDGAPPPKEDTPCEAAIMAVLREATYPIIADVIETRANKKALEFSTSTIHHTLARLTRTKRVLNSKKPPRGYYLPGKAFAKPASDVHT